MKDLVVILIIVVTALILVGCSSSSEVSNPYIDQVDTFPDETIGWAVIDSGPFDDQVIVHRYEPTMGWHSLTISSRSYRTDTLTVSATFIRKAEGVCYETTVLRKNSTGLLTNPLVARRPDSCDKFRKVFKQLYGERTVY